MTPPEPTIDVASPRPPEGEALPATDRRLQDVTGDPAFRDGQPAAWTFHRATCRWTYNVLDAPPSRPPLPGREDPLAALVALPDPTELPEPLDGALRARLSCRAFVDEPVTLPQLATLLWSGYGVHGPVDAGPLELQARTVPSGGGLYPLELHVLARSVDGLDPGVHHYVPTHHGLEAVRDGLVPSRLTTYLFMGQPYAAEAAAVIVLAGVPGRSLWKYGDRGYRYLLMEAGHVAQNINLAAIQLGLGSCNLGGFFDDELAGLLRLDVEEEFPVYAVAVGRPDDEVGDLRAVREVPPVRPS